jgi:hypothetical protein
MIGRGGVRHAVVLGSTAPGELLQSDLEALRSFMRWSANPSKR